MCTQFNNVKWYSKIWQQEQFYPLILFPTTSNSLNCYFYTYLYYYYIFLRNMFILHFIMKLLPQLSIFPLVVSEDILFLLPNTYPLQNCALLFRPIVSHVYYLTSPTYFILILPINYKSYLVFFHLHL